MRISTNGLRAAALTPPLVAFIASSRMRSEPYWMYSALRRVDPVHQSPLGLVLLTRHADVAALLRNPSASSEEHKADPSLLKVDKLGNLLGRRHEDLVEDGPFFEWFARVMLFRDPPDHTRLRALVSKAFTPKQSEAIAPRVQRIVDEMLDAFAPRRGMDLMRDFAYPLPARVICELLGVPASDAEQIISYARPLAIGLDPSPMRSREAVVAANHATSELVEYLEGLIKDRRNQPGDDLLSQLIAAQENGDRLEPDELISTMFLMLIAGHETTANLIGNGVLALLRNPEQLAQLRGDPALDPAAIEELLRYDSPIQMTQRVALDDIELADQTVSAGRLVIAMLGAANRDPSVFEHPDRLDITRTPNPHLAFGSGPHFCIGAALARVEARAAIGTLVRRFPNLMVTAPPKRRPSFTIRGLEHLNLAW